jgi:hypothetical protein
MKRYSQRYHKTLEERLGRKKTIGNSWTWKGGGFSSTIKRDIQDIAFGHRTTNWISGGGDWNCREKHRYKIIGFYVD